MALQLKKEIKVSVVGDGAVGKTSLLHAYTTGRGQLPDDYSPTVFDTYTAKVPVDGEEIRLTIADTAGQEEYAFIRSLAYSSTDVFIVCFSLISPTSAANIRSLWAPDIHRHLPNARKILVGTKLDLREQPVAVSRLAERGLAPVTSSQGEALATEIGATAYVECSSVTLQGVQQVFAKAVQAGLAPESSNKKKVGSKKERCVMC